MYIFGTLLTIGALIRRRSVTIQQAIWLFIIANILLATVQYMYPEARRILFAALLIPGIIIEFLPGTIGTAVSFDRIKYMVMGLALLVAAYAIWLLDQNGIICWPKSIMQGHAVWHILTAAAGYMIIFHYIRTSHLRNT
jgi:hypothetical protein